MKTTLAQTAPWHYASYTHFTNEALPALLEKHLGIERAAAALAALTLPEMNEGGWFSELPGRPSGWKNGWVVLPHVATENLEGAEIRCVGELLAAFLDERLTSWHGSELPPLNDWLVEFFTNAYAAPDTLRTTQHQNRSSVLGTYCQLRRLFIGEEPVQGWHPSHVGRICAIENPEGSYAGRILTIARGAKITDGKLVPGEETIGVAASCIPFLAHTSDARALMGAIGCQQMTHLPGSEPALVQTGGEPDEEDFWCGVNLRTAFIPWGRLTHEDALILSESAAQKLTGPENRPLKIGHKMLNRHGAKGIVGAILPDGEMPHGEDGRPIELIYPFFGVSTRRNHGQLFEAALGAAVEREGGKFALAPPFGGPSPEEIQARRESVGLSQDGLEQLTDGAGGEKLARRSATGIVYWGYWSYAEGYETGNELEVGGLTIGAAEYRLLREAGADTVLTDFFGGWAKNLLPERLGALGISLNVADGALTFVEPSGEIIELGEGFAHPWIPEREILRVGKVEELSEWEPLREATSRLERMKASTAPPKLIAEARKALETRLWDYADALLPKDALQPKVEVPRSGRSVCAPAPWPDADKIGLPGPLFDACEGASWVLVHAYQSPLPTSFVALKPVRVDGDAIRFPVQFCPSLDTNFDGDQLTVFAPSTAEAAEELGRLLSPVGQLQRDPARLLSPYGGLLLGHGAFYGLAELVRESGGIDRISALVGRPVAVSGLCLTRADLERPLKQVLTEDGPEAALAACVRLATTGFEASKRSGASFSVFAHPPFPTAPKSDTPRVWEVWDTVLADAAARLPETLGFDSDTLGPTILAAASGARGQLSLLVDGRGVQKGARIGHGLMQGLTLDEWLAQASAYRLWLRGYYNVNLFVDPFFGKPAVEPFVAWGTGVMARAMRSAHPGVVLARAAASGERDPLTELDTRLLVGTATGHT